MRERGLKYKQHQIEVADLRVAPHAGAWIEITANRTIRARLLIVAPHAGAWIEIKGATAHDKSGAVAPHAGAWIEMS